MPRHALFLLATLALALHAPRAQAEPASAAPPRPPAAPTGHKGPAEPLPDPDLRVRVVAPSAKGPWSLHLENEGESWLRVPADLRLLRFTVESGDTMSKRPTKPVQCAVPAGLRIAAFPDRNALLLGPGDAYVEAFDPRLFCFGKDAAALVGGALVRARYGWDAPARGARRVDPPFAVEGTTFPASVEPKKQIVAPSFVLSWLPPEEDEAEAAKEAAEKAAEKAADADEKDGEAAEKDAKPPVEKIPVDENAARFELTGPAHIDALDGFKVTLTLTLTNVGHRPAHAAVRTKMVGFHIDGPDGFVGCHASPASHNLPREAFATLKPGASTSLTLLVQEACGQDVFRRPGLYRVTPTLHLDERSPDPALVPFLGVVHAREPTLVRIAEGPAPFYKSPPQPIRAPAPTSAEKTEEKPGGS